MLFSYRRDRGYCGETIEAPAPNSLRVAGIVGFRLGLILVLAASLWGQNELMTPTLRSTFNVREDVQAIVLSPDGKLGAVGTRNGGVGVFSLESTGDVHWVAHYKKRVNAIVFNRAGSFVAAAGDDGIVSLVSLPSYQIKELSGHGRKIFTLAFSPDGQFLASAGEDKEVTMWDPNTGTEQYSLARDSGKHVIYVGFNGMGTTLFGVDESGAIWEWDVKNRKQVRRQKDSDRTVYSATTSFSGDYLALGTEFEALQKQAIHLNDTIRPTDLYRESRIKLYEAGTLAIAKTIEEINGQVVSIALSADNHYVAAARERINESFLSVYDVQRATEVVSFPSSGFVHAVAFSADGRSLASGTSTGEVKIYAIKGITPGGEVGDLKGMKFTVIPSQSEPLIPKNANITVGVVDFEAYGVDTGTAQAVAELLRTRIVANSSVTVVERAKMEKIIHEQDFQYSGLADKKTAVNLGRLLGARKMIFGSVGKLGTSMTIHTEMVDVEKGTIDGSCDLVCQQCAGEDLPEAVAKLKHSLVADSH